MKRKITITLTVTEARELLLLAGNSFGVPWYGYSERDYLGIRQAGYDTNPGWNKRRDAFIKGRDKIKAVLAESDSV